MAEFNVRDQDKYASQGGGGYFSLKEDREIGQVRILYDTVEDVKGYTVHEIQLDDKKRYVNCIHEYGQPKDDCPFCAAGKFTTTKYFVPMYNLKENRLQTWERGKTFGPEIQSKLARFPHLYQRVTEIERIGKKGDTKTTYQIYPGDQLDDVYLEDFDIQNPLGTLVLDKSAEEMNYYLNTGSFPMGENRDARPVRGDSSRNSSQGNANYDRPVRRPQASNNTDRF